MSKEGKTADSILLVPYDPKHEKEALAWYRDRELCLMTDGKEDLYDAERLHRMYAYLDARGDCFWIMLDGQPVGDVTLYDSGEIAVVIAPAFQKRGIGRISVREMILLAREKGMQEVWARIFAFNEKSRKLFASLGFRNAGEDRYVLSLNEPCGIVFSDADGTRLTGDKRILPGTVDAIRQLQKKGIPFVIVSGRHPAALRHLFDTYSFRCPLICCGGSLVLDEDGTVLLERGIAPKRAGDLVRFVEERRYDCTWNIYSGDRWIVKDENDRRTQRVRRVLRVLPEEGTADSLFPDDLVHKALLIGEPGDMPGIEAEVREAFPDLFMARSADWLLEIMPGSVTKGRAVRFLCGKWNIPMEQTVAFGDHHNDVEMLEAVRIPFLMGNAPQELKDGRFRITDTNEADGIRKALVQLGLIG